MSAAAPRPPLWTAPFLLMGLAALAFFSAFHLLTPTLPLHLQALGVTGPLLGVMIAVFMIASMMARPAMGRWADRAPKKRLMTVGAGAFALLTPIYLLPLHDGLLMILRAAHGLAFSLFIAAYYGHLLSLLPDQRRAEALSMHSNLVMLALALGPAAGLRLMAGWTMAGVVWTSFALGALALALCAWLPSSSADPGPARHADPEPAPQAWIHPKALFPGALMASVSVLYGAVIPFAPLIGHEKGMTDLSALYLLYTVGIILTRVASGPLSDRYGRAAVLIPALAFSGLSVAMMAWVSSASAFLWAAFLYGLTSGAVQPSLMALVADRLHERERANAMATFTTFGDLGMALGSLAVGGLGAFWGYGHALAAPASCALVGAVALTLAQWRARRRHRQAQTAPVTSG